MTEFRSLDALVRARLKAWPQQPPGIDTYAGKPGAWFRGRPGDASSATHPFLKLPGSNRLRTLPDGLWLNFGGTKAEPFVDIFAIEACASLQNLLDKRSRFAPSTQSLLAWCPVPWLLGAVVPGETTPRWKAAGVFAQQPTAAVSLPVRNVRVMYGLNPRHYRGFAESQVPHAHEYFVPMEALTAKDGDKDPLIQNLISRASAKANFLATS
jgi:hypothetical protein